MPVQKRSREHRCKRCGKVFTSRMRLQHHIAAEHAPRISRDICTTRDIPHGKPSKPRRYPLTRD